MEKNRKISFLRKIELKWEFEWRHYPHRLKYGIQNLYYYFNVVWNDRSWDHTKIYDLMIRKMEITSRRFDKYNNYISGDIDVQKMKLCIKLLKLVREEFYDLEYIEYIKSDFEFIPSETVGENGEKFYEMKSTVRENNLEKLFQKYPKTYQKILSGKINLHQRDNPDKEDKVIAMEICHYNQKKCNRILFEFLRHNIGRWWY